MKTFLQWLNEEGMGNPGTPYPDGQKPSDSLYLGKNKGKLDNSGQSGGPGPKKGGPTAFTPQITPAAKPK